MSLSSDEEHALEVIERGLRRQDPLLADRLASAQTIDQRLRHAAFARYMMIVGAVLILLGLNASEGFISLGTLLGGYGLIIFLVAVAVAARNRTHASIARGRRLRPWF